MIYSILIFLVFLKLLFFWLWLWQLKEYHIGRFVAHFKEGQVIKKILSSFWRLKYPKFTKKIIVISFVSISLAILMLSKGFYFFTFLLVVFIPLTFQIPTAIWKKRLLEKARKKREQFPDLLVIGITGSYAKTSVKEFLYTILSSKFNVLKTKEHKNSEVGIAQTILNELAKEHQIFIVEMGAYNVGGIKLLCDMVSPKIGILTGINEQHLATFGSLENIIKTKFELIESLPKGGIAFFNGKNRYCVDLYQKTKIKKKLYGQEAKTAGLENIEGAKAVAQELGLTEKEIWKACREIKEQLPSIKLKKGKNNIDIIDATYSANPDGVIAHLDYLKTLIGKKMIIMPCLIELGSASQEVHQRIGRKIAQTCDWAIITTKDRFKEIKEGAQEEGMKPENILFLEKPEMILEKIKLFCNPGDVILLESRVPNNLIQMLIN
jgi:UDP-N-acetylmuramoyl-tripeptide--D-alanyl-D-alanine ligase